MKDAVGIVAYGAEVPRARIRTSEIARVWGDEAGTGEALGVLQKSVPRPDEDVATMSVEAARMAYRRGPGAQLQDLGAIYIGSESHPYAVKPTGTIVQAALGAPEAITMADYEFACKAGTAAIQTGVAWVRSSMAKQVLAIGADTSQGAPSNALEYSASAGAAAYVIGSGESVLARLDHTCSFTTDTPDFWRREGQMYPQHGERFTGQPAYFRHVAEASKALMAEMGTTAEDYDYAVLHQPNGKFPVAAAKQLGFEPKQYETGLLAPRIGNTYSGAVVLGLANILDQARPGDRIFMCGYGSGAGSDAFHWTVTDAIDAFDRSEAELLETQLADTHELDYALYAKWRGKLNLGGA